MKNKKQTKILVCPRCGSTNWKVPMYFDQFGGPPTEIKNCGDCGFKGPFIETDIEKVKEVQDKIKENKEEEVG
ncbi:hypothetical protein A3K73_05090 [Candidatus Pacearchaeota archaeon RBG_13_36_9]|nr:MAG: hypothetical protein A3K73_05090 [Candidatus Pacearchaeota archaeon RBG_13_36_9]